ncbi:hypothetical protein C3L23_06160 [Nautilia sp. PV-1]|uniref:hypothetical protein n=1 Tax=Nautilia sp. PV-1 TaxID=2579250 RepID=UPI000FD95449|nr:hypothetical protein [Nautilia sp. PV-1]AZV46870.1 hypothetical protein C3L23_06160 [Nautilia sp. PV-1]
MNYSENRIRKIRKEALKNEKIVTDAIKKYGKDIEGYKVISYSELGKITGLHPGVVRDVCKRLEKRDELEIKESFALFGTLMLKGFKIKGDENDN